MNKKKRGIALADNTAVTGLNDGFVTNRQKLCYHARFSFLGRRQRRPAYMKSMGRNGHT